MKCKSCITYVMCRNKLIECYNAGKYSLYGAYVMSIMDKCKYLDEGMEGKTVDYFTNMLVKVFALKFNNPTLPFKKIS